MLFTPYAVYAAWDCAIACPVLEFCIFTNIAAYFMYDDWDCPRGYPTSNAYICVCRYVLLMSSCVGGSKVPPRIRCECYINFRSAISTSCTLANTISIVQSYFLGETVCCGP